MTEKGKQRGGGSRPPAREAVSGMARVGEVLGGVLRAFLVFVAANLIFLLFAWLRGKFEVILILVVGVAVGLLAAIIVWLSTTPKSAYRVLAVSLTFLAITALTCLVGFVGKMAIEPPVVDGGNLDKEEPKKKVVRIKKKWDFEAGTLEGWGVYDEKKGRIVQCLRVVEKPEDSPEGSSCLEVDMTQIPETIDLKATSDQGVKALKIPLAVVYQGGLSEAKVTASVYIPSDVDYDYADAKFFLFAGPDWEWHEGGRDGLGELLHPGNWADVTWDLRAEDTDQWPSPWPYRGVLGIQVYVEAANFTGRVYIDNVSVIEYK